MLVLNAIISEIICHSAKFVIMTGLRDIKYMMDVSLMQVAKNRLSVLFVASIFFNQMQSFCASCSGIKGDY